MKKFISIIILLLNMIQFTDMQCFAKCEEPSISAKELNLDVDSLKQKVFFDKYLDDRTVNVTTIDVIKDFAYDLNKEALNALQQMVVSWNSRLDEKTIDIMANLIKNIFLGKYGTENTDALVKGLEYIEKITTNTTLSDEEKIEAVKDGQLRAAMGLSATEVVSGIGGAAAGVAVAKIAAETIGAVGSSIGAGTGTLAGGAVSVIGHGLGAVAAEAGSANVALAAAANAAAGGASISEAIFAGKVAGDTFATISAATNVAENAAFVTEIAGAVTNTVGTAVSSVVTPVLMIGVAALCCYGVYRTVNKVSTAIYNKYFSDKPYNEAYDEYNKNLNLFQNVVKAIYEHEWIGNNILTTAQSKEKNCGKAFARFERIKGINYNKTKSDINNDFAALECELLGYPDGHPNSTDCKEEALKFINCQWENVYDTSKCSMNPYYKKAIEQSSQLNNCQDTNKDEL